MRYLWIRCNCVQNNQTIEQVGNGWNNWNISISFAHSFSIRIQFVFVFFLFLSLCCYDNWCNDDDDHRKCIFGFCFDSNFVLFPISIFFFLLFNCANGVRTIYNVTLCVSFILLEQRVLLYGIGMDFLKIILA